MNELKMNKLIIS